MAARSKYSSHRQSNGYIHKRDYDWSAINAVLSLFGTSQKVNAQNTSSRLILVGHHSTTIKVIRAVTHER